MTEYYFVFVLKESLFLNFKRKNNKKCVTHTHRYMRFKELLCIKNAYKKINNRSFIVMDFIYHNCALCNYKTKRKFDLKRHQNAMHNKPTLNNEEDNISTNNFNFVGDNFNFVGDNFNYVGNDNKCNKCNKILSSKYYLQKHLVICKGVSNPLECHLCHKIYACRTSKSKHLKICREKSLQLVPIVEEPILEVVPIPSQQQSQQLVQAAPQQINNNTQIILNNNKTYNNNCNNTYNINLIRFNEEELKIDFDSNHLEEENNIIHKLYIIAPEDGFRKFYKKLFENKNNQMVIKKSLRHTYSKVHTGLNIWQIMLDDYIYHIIMHFISETMLSYIYNHTKNKQDPKYKQLRDYLDCMATKGYSNSKDAKEIEKSYKNHIKSLKYLFNTFKDDDDNEEEI